MQLKLNNKGFNLVVMSIIVLVMSMIMASTVSLYSMKNIKERVIETKNKFKFIEIALMKFAIENGRFPCPAPLNCSNIDGCENAGYFIGRENGSMNKNLDGTCADIAGGIFTAENSDDKNIYYGGIPALTLGLSSDFLTDSWGNKITYMISEDSVRVGSFNEMIYNKRHEITTNNYLRDGIVYLLLSFNKNNMNAFPIDSQTVYSGSSSGQVGIITDFVNNGINTNYFNFYKKYTDFDATNLEKQLQKCLATTKDSFSFPEANYGEIVFANESCQTKITHQLQSAGYNNNNDYYYIAVYINNNIVYTHNKPSLKCKEDGNWSSDYLYLCKKMDECRISDLSVKYQKADLPSFDIVNTATVTFREDKDDIDSIEMTFICIVDALPNGNWQAKWYRKN